MLKKALLHTLLALNYSIGMFLRVLSSMFIGFAEKMMVMIDKR